MKAKMSNKTPNIEDLHKCDKSEGKIVGICVDDIGIIRCGYCNEIVDYSPLWNNIEFKNKMLECLEYKNDKSTD